MQSTIVPKLMNKRHQLALGQWQTVIKAYKKEQTKQKNKNKIKNLKAAPDPSLANKASSA